MEDPIQGNPLASDPDCNYLGDWALNLTNAFLAGMTERLAPYDITPVQLAILYKCYLGEADTVTGLTRLIPLGAPAISRQIEQLSNKGLIERTRLPDDRRVVRLSLTEMALELVPVGLQHQIENEAMLLQGVSEERKNELISTIQTILTNFENNERRLREEESGLEG